MPATEPSASETTGTSDMFSTTCCQTRISGSRVWPLVSMLRTEPPPPVPSTSRTTGRRRSPAMRSAWTSLSPTAPSLAPPRTGKSSPISTTGRASISPCPITTFQGPAARGEAAAHQPHRAGVDLRVADHQIRGPQAGDLAVRVVLAAAGERADFLERARIGDGLDPFAHRQLAGVFVPLHFLGAAHLLRELLAPLQLVDFGLPGHADLF